MTLTSLTPVIYKSALISSSLSLGVSLFHRATNEERALFIVAMTVTGITIGLFGALVGVCSASGIIAGGVYGAIYAKEHPTADKVRCIIAGMIIGATLGYVLDLMVALPPAVVIVR